MTLVCAAVAAAPDLDLLFHTHRTYTHSVGAMIFVALFAAALAANARRPIVATALTVAAAYGSHLLLDWMAVDRTFPYGIQALWPFDSGWYISGWDVFRQTVRRQFLSPHSIQQNLLAVGQEIAILGPIAWAVWSVRVKTLAGLPAELPGGDHSTE